MNKFVCKNCGGSNVEIRAWVDANNFQFKEFTVDEDGFCNDCMNLVELVTYDEYWCEALDNENIKQEDINQ